jgi:hypothetical protein
MLRPASLLVAALLISGCSSFEKEWAAAPASAPDGVSGRWIGNWQNTNNTHGGALRAVVKPDGKEAYTARFHAEWGSHSGSFRTPLPGVFKDGEYGFRGSRRILGVKITTAGSIGTNGFDATYDSAFDSGIFQLQRTER